MIPATLRLGLLLCLLGTCIPGLAGQHCSSQPPDAYALRSALQLAHRTRVVLEESGAELALIGRIGADLSAQNLRYSHAGFVRRAQGKGAWLVTHLLNQCGAGSSALFDEGLGNFFLDNPFAYEAVLAIPEPAIQRAILQVLDSGLPVRLHTPAYSMIANPLAVRYQNSNQWLLETLAAALATDMPVHDRTTAQQWLRGKHYAPSSIRVSPMQRLGARLFRANIRFDDHPPDAHRAGRYDVVSVESVIAFLASLDAAMTTRVVALP